jgi:phage-related protein
MGVFYPVRWRAGEIARIFLSAGEDWGWIGRRGLPGAQGLDLCLGKETMGQDAAAIFHVRAREAIRGFSEAARMSAGHAIWELQRGIRLTMPLSRPMPAVAPGVEELRIRDAAGAFRVFYFCRDVRGVLVFHAFTKKSQRAPKDEIETGRKRLKELLNEIV